MANFTFNFDFLYLKQRGFGTPFGKAISHANNLHPFPGTWDFTKTGIRVSVYSKGDKGLGDKMRKEISDLFIQVLKRWDRKGVIKFKP